MPKSKLSSSGALAGWYERFRTLLRFEPWPLASIIWAALALPLILLCFRLKQTIPTFARENGPMENFQAICLVSGVLVLFLSSLSGRQIGWRILKVGLALFYGTMLVLEVDTRSWDWPVLNHVLNGWIRNLWLLAFWVGGAVLFFRNLQSTWDAFSAWIRRPAGALLLISGLFWVSSAFVDKAVLGTKNLFWEELPEVVATWLMLQASVETWILARRFSQNPPAAER